MKLSAIVAASYGGIGIDNKLPWHYKEDLKHFKLITTNHIVIMGRKTFESLNNQPLPNRINIVLSKEHKTNENEVQNDNLIFVNSLNQCINYCEYLYKIHKDKKIFVIGGAAIYKLFFSEDLINEIYYTNIIKHYACDTFWTPNLTNWHKTTLRQTNEAEFYLYKNISNKEEQSYLDLLNDILTRGNAVKDRTGTGTIQLFGKQLTFDLSNNKFPLFTTRKMFLRGIFEELMMILRGQTDTTILEEKGIKIWQGNTSREFLDKRKLPYAIGDMGPAYGFSMRHFGGQYDSCKTNYGKCRCDRECKMTCILNGTDQLQNLISEIKTNPSSRRLRISLWDVNNLDKMALPPCLEQYQFSVCNGKISCMMTQRSSDIFLAGGWNVATGSLFTYLLASVCNLVPDKLIWNIGDVHIYNNLIEQSQELIRRVPYDFPTIKIKQRDDIESFQFEDVELLNYQCHPALSGKMSV